MPHFHVSENEDEGLPSRQLSKISKMFLAVTIHNVPEGLSVGIAFGVALANQNNYALLIGALLLAVGIGLQNIPEGAWLLCQLKGRPVLLKSFLIWCFFRSGRTNRCSYWFIFSDANPINYALGLSVSGRLYDLCRC